MYRKKRRRDSGFPFNILEALLNAGLLALERRVDRAVATHGEKVVVKIRQFLLRLRRQ